MSETTTEAPAEDPTPLGWLNTADHKRVGRLFIVKATMFLVLGAALDLLLRVDLTDASDFVVFDSSTFAQTFAMSREVLVLMFVIPVFAKMFQDFGGEPAGIPHKLDFFACFYCYGHDFAVNYLI